MRYVELICAIIGGMVFPIIIIVALLYDDGARGGSVCMTDDCPRSMQYDR